MTNVLRSRFCLADYFSTGRLWPRLGLRCNLLFEKIQTFFFFFFAKIEFGLYFLDRFDVLMSKIIFKK